MSKQLYKTVITVEILSEEPFVYTNLEDINNEITEGACSGRIDVQPSVVIEGDQAILEACNEHGTAVAFFFPDNDEFDEAEDFQTVETYQINGCFYDVVSCTGRDSGTTFYYDVYERRPGVDVSFAINEGDPFYTLPSEQDIIRYLAAQASNDAPAPSAYEGYLPPMHGWNFG